MNSQDILKLKKDRHRKIFWCVMTFSLIAFTFGFILPPPGQIDYSVIIAVGAVMLFAVLYIIIDSNMAMKLSLDLDDKKVEISTQEKEAADD